MAGLARLSKSREKIILLLFLRSLAKFSLTADCNKQMSVCQ